MRVRVRYSRVSFAGVLVTVVLVGCDQQPTVPSAQRSPEAEASATPSPNLIPIEARSCRGLHVPTDREVNTNLDREGGILEFDYYVARLQRSRVIAIRYRDDPWCGRNPETRRLIQHVRAGREVVECLDLPDRPPDAMVRVDLWFGDSSDESAIAPLLVVQRDIEPTDAIAAATLGAWIEGPTKEEKEAGAIASAPEGSKLIGIDIHDGTAVVDLNEAFERSGAGTIYEGAILEQLAGIITQFETVDRALLKIEGRFQDGYMGHGFMVDEEHPLEKPAKNRYRVAPQC
ncbi:MAG TPA: GerMN domain-containing protein [Actinomycetota bacterium]|nr:GerMN domain-containing protein [Actinomycetota bacterium]